MRSSFSTAFVVLASVTFSALASPAVAADPPDAAELRLENEAKVSVPNEMTEDVWTFLKDGESSLMRGLHEFGSDFSVKASVEQFIDVYYDDSDFKLLGKQSGVRFRQRFIPDNPMHPKHGRRLVQIKMHLENESASTRGEIKFKVPKTLALKSDFPHVGSLLKKNDVEVFLRKLAEFGVNGFELRPTLRIEQERRRIYISKGKDAFATITLDLVRSKRFWTSHRFTEIEIELSEIGYTYAGADKRKFMERVMHAMTGAILKAFPGTEINQTPKYNKMFTRFSDDIPMFKILLQLAWIV